jgi:hypothetical protein
MEVVALLAGEEHSDRPACACPVITTVVQCLNDDATRHDRDALLKPLLHNVVGSRSTLDVELVRIKMVAEWYARTYAATWLEAVGHPTPAARLRGIDCSLGTAAYVQQVVAIFESLDDGDSDWVTGSGASGETHMLSEVLRGDVSVDRAVVVDQLPESWCYVAYLIGERAKRMSPFQIAVDFGSVRESIRASLADLIRRMLAV